MSRFEEIAHEVAAEGTDAAWAARDAILELVAEVDTLWQLVDEQNKHREVLERTALLREEVITTQNQVLDEVMKVKSMRGALIEEQSDTIAKQAGLIKKQSEAIKRLMGKGVIRA
jgi:hypothetical protein